MAGFVFPLAAGKWQILQHGEDIFLDRQLRENAVVLREVAHARLSSTVHRPSRDVVAVEKDSAFRRRDHAAGHVEGCCLAGSVRAEKSDDLAGSHLKADAVDRPLASGVILHEAAAFQQRCIGLQFRDGLWSLGLNLRRSLCGGVSLFSHESPSLTKHGMRIPKRRV